MGRGHRKTFAHIVLASMNYFKLGLLTAAIFGVMVNNRAAEGAPGELEHEILEVELHYSNLM